MRDCIRCPAFPDYVRMDGCPPCFGVTDKECRLSLDGDDCDGCAHCQAVRLRNSRFETEGWENQMKEENEAKIDELADGFAEALKKEARSLANSGAIDEESYDSRYYLFAKVLITASIHRLKDQLAPPEGFHILREEVENLKRI